MTAATNKVESFNRFSRWVGFGNQGLIADNDPVEQEKAMKFNALLTNALTFHNALDIAEIVRQLLEEGWEIDPEGLAQVSPYLTEHIKRFGSLAGLAVLLITARTSRREVRREDQRKAVSLLTVRSVMMTVSSGSVRAGIEPDGVVPIRAAPMAR